MIKQAFRWIVVMALVAAPAVASAANYVVHIHGRTQTTWDDTIYWISGYTSVKCDYEAKYNTLSQSNVTVRDCLGTYCSGSNSCIVVAYSNGANQVHYTQQYYPSKLANLQYVESGGSAEGGSELTDVGSAVQSFLDWFGIDFEVYYPNGVDATLSVSSARNAYNHDINNGKTTYHVSGNTNAGNGLWWATAGFLPGDDDGVVSWASSYGCRDSGDQPTTCSKFTGHVSDTWCVSNGEWDGYDHFSMDERASWCY